MHVAAIGAGNIGVLVEVVGEGRVVGRPKCSLHVLPQRRTLLFEAR